MTRKSVSIAMVAAALCGVAASETAWARPFTPTIDRDTFKARCLDSHGAFTSFRDGNVNCDLPRGGVAICNFIVPSCIYRGPKELNFLAG